MDRTAGNATEASDIATETDVLIIGAGPVGLTLALLLAARGRTVAIYEQHEAPYPLPRAVGMSHDSVRTYQAAGVLPRLDGLLDIQWRDMVGQFTNAEGEVLFATTYPGRSESGYPTMTGFNQPDLEAALERCCRDDLRITTHRGWRVEALTQQRDQVLASLTAFAKHDGGAKAKPITAAARFVVGCDGANSSVASLMATTVTDTGFASSWLVVDIVPKTPRIWDPELGQSLDPARPITIVPAGPGRRRFELMALPGETPEVLSNPATVWPLLAKFDVTPENAELVRSAFYTFRGRWANEWRDGRILLAGDAAHQMPPFLGQGFNSGIRDVMALAWRLDRVLAGASPIAILDSYGSERLAHVRQVIEQSVEIGKMICITDPQIAAQRDAGLRLMRGAPGSPPPPKLPPWRLGAGILMPGDANAGYLGVQGRVVFEDRERLADDVFGSGRFVLFGNRIDPAGALSETARVLWAEIEGVSITIGDAVRDLDGTYADWFAKLGCAVVLVRPDFQVYGTAPEAAGASDLVVTLAQQLGVSALTSAAVPAGS